MSNYTVYLNSYSYPQGAMEVHFASGLLRKSLRTRIQEVLNGWVSPVAEFHNFSKSFKEHEHVVFHGGDTPTLLEYLRYDQTWLNYLEGKTLWGFSAGVSAMAYRSFNVDHKRIITGMALIPYQTIVHYNDSMEYMVNSLYQSCGLPVLAVPDRKAFKITVQGFYSKLEAVYD